MATIASIATGNSDLNILVNALGFIDANTTADLIGTLSDASQDLTVFAPTDAAFTQLALDLGFDGDATDEDAVTGFLATELGPNTLLDVVLYHVSGGAKTAAELGALDEIPTLNTATIGQALPRLRDNEPDLLDPSVIAADIPASNGIVHLIDRVLLPMDLEGNDAPTIAGIVASSGDGFDADGTDFDILLKAAQTADLVGALDDETADLTAFAPTDTAFINLARDLGFHGHDEEGAWTYLVDALTVLSKGDPIGLLTDVLSYHVTTPSVQSSQVIASDGGSIDTLLEGASIGIDGTTLVDADTDATDPNLDALDIQAKNGVVHTIDAVLRPANLPDGDKIQILDDGKNFALGTGDADFVLAKGGNDFISTRGGDDVVLGGHGYDRIFGAGGDDHLMGERGNDGLFGGHGNDMLDGGVGNDLILGGNGHDTIIGGEGHDKIFGGKGADTFVIDENSGSDLIFDFGRGHDRIDLTAFELDGFHEVHINRGFFSTTVQVEDTSVTLAWVGPNGLQEDDFIL